MTSLKELSEQLAQINKLYSTPVPVYLNFSHEEPLGTIKGNQNWNASSKVDNLR